MDENIKMDEKVTDDIESSKRDKRKAFIASQETINRTRELAKRTGKQEADWFEDLINEMFMKQTAESEDIPQDLRTHFQSDIMKLRNATSSIISLFTSQMDNIKVEKESWETTRTKQLEAVNGKLKEKVRELDEWKMKHEVLQKNLAELEKSKQEAEKERDTLLKNSELRDRLEEERQSKIKELDNDIEELKEMLDNKEKQLKELTPFREENKRLNAEINDLKQQMVQMSAQHKAALQSQENELNFKFREEKLEERMRLQETHRIEMSEAIEKARQEAATTANELYKDLLHEAREDARNREEKLERELAESQKEKEARAKENEDLKKQMEAIKKEMDELRETNERLRKTKIGKQGKHQVNRGETE